MQKKKNKKKNPKLARSEKTVESSKTHTKKMLRLHNFDSLKSNRVNKLPPYEQNCVKRNKKYITSVPSALR